MFDCQKPLVQIVGKRHRRRLHKDAHILIAQSRREPLLCILFRAVDSLVEVAALAIGLASVKDPHEPSVVATFDYLSRHSSPPYCQCTFLAPRSLTWMMRAI